MKIKLELNLVEDGRVFLNYWENIHGKDVCCEVIDGNLYIDPEDGTGDTTPYEISLDQFIELVKKNIPPQ